MTIIRPQSRVEAVLYTFAHGILVLTPWLTGFTSAKHLSQPEGQITLSVKWPERQFGDLRRIVKDGDWLLLGTRGPKGWRRRQGFSTATTRRLTVGASGEKVAVYTLTFGDEGHPFARHEFRTHPLLPTGCPGMLRPDASLMGMVLAASEYQPREVLRRSIVAMMRPSNVRKKASKPAASGSGPGNAAAGPPKAPAPLEEGQLTANFHIKEFRSPDGALMSASEQANIKELAGYLQILRDTYWGGRKVTIVSGHRSLPYNVKKAKSKPTSRHIMGKAADVRVDGLTPVEVAAGIADALNAGAIPAKFGVFIYRTFIHYDIGTTGDGGKKRPAWAPADPATTSAAKLPTQEQIDAFLALEPTLGSAVTTAPADDGDAAESGEYPAAVPESETELVPGESGSGAFVVPPSLYGAAIGTTRPALTASGEPSTAPRWDWLDVCDLFARNDPQEGIRGRWWMLNGFYSMGKAQVDGFLRSQADPAFCELFYDSRRVPSSASKLARIQDGWVPVVVFRRRPFDKADWDALPSCTVDWAHVKDEDLARGGAERFNYFYARPLTSGEISGPVFDEAVGGGQGVIPAIALEEFLRWGQRSMEVEGRFIFPLEAKGNAEAVSLPEQVRDFTATLYRWFKPLPDFYGGTLEIPWLDAECVIGARLVANGRGGPFDGPAHAYIEGVTENFVVDPQSGAVQGRTHVQVTRMQPLDQYAAPEPTSWKSAQGTA